MPGTVHRLRVGSHLPRLAIAALLAISAAGCISAQKQALSEDASIESIRLDSHVTLPEGMYYVGPGLGTGMLFGAIGAAAASGGNESEAELLARFAAEHGIDITAIVHDAFERRLKEIGKYPLSESAGTVMSLEIKQYGLSIPHGLSRRLVPVLLVQAQLADANGNVLWKGGDHVMPLGGPAEAVKLDDIQADPDVLRGLWQAAAERTAERTLGQL